MALCTHILRNKLEQCKTLLYTTETVWFVPYDGNILRNFISFVIFYQHIFLSSKALNLRLLCTLNVLKVLKF